MIFFDSSHIPWGWSSWSWFPAKNKKKCLNVRQKLGTRITLSLTLSLFQSLIHSLSTCWTTFIFMSMIKSHTHTLPLTHSLSHSYFLIHSLSTCWTTFVLMSRCSKVTLSLLHSLTLALLHSHSLSFSHSLSLDMLNNFCFHVYAQKSLFIGENDNVYFWTSTSSPLPVRLEFIELVPS